MTFRNDERARAIARQAYQTLEPLHIIAYFGPEVTKTYKRDDIGFYGWYVGMRAAPLGAAAPSVVSAAFYNFRPEVIEEGWRDALGVHTPEDLLQAREQIVDTALTGALGELLGSDELPRVVDRLHAVLEKADKPGRPLGAANIGLDRDLPPHVALWQASATWREWRGDGHIAALVANGLPATEALVLHEAKHPDPKVKGFPLGKAALQGSRSWSDEQWAAAADNLRSRGVIEGEGDDERLTPAGVEFYQLIEDQTDDAAASIWADVDDAEDLLAAVRPFVKAVIDAGLIPGAR